MKLSYLSEPDFDTLRARWAQKGLVATVRGSSNLALERIDPTKNVSIDLRSARAYTSPKALLFPARELVAVYSTARNYSSSPSTTVHSEPLIVLGVRNCDLAAIALMDRLFMEGEYKDPFYAEHRKQLLFVSADCIVDAESCFCDLVDVEPFCTRGFDINLSPVRGGYVVEIGSDQGARLLETEQALFTDASEEQLAERQANRKAIKDKLVAKNERFRTTKPIPQVIQEALDSEDWNDQARLCVECGACTHICPACHCFYLFDRLRVEPGSKPGEFARVREWDSCLFADYARMAGPEAGKPNPRPRLRSRLENRFTHKYLYLPQTYGAYGCSGCGRCLDACGGGIDPRKVIKDLEKK